jgi:hypothetical protein
LTFTAHFIKLSITLVDKTSNAQETYNGYRLPETITVNGKKQYVRIQQVFGIFVL